MDDEERPTQRVDHVPVVTAIAALANPRLPEEQREKILNKISRRLPPPPFACETCQDTGMIVTVDEHRIFRGRRCACSYRRELLAAEQRKAAETFEFKQSREEDEEAFDFQQAEGT